MLMHLRKFDHGAVTVNRQCHFIFLGEDDNNVYNFLMHGFQRSPKKFGKHKNVNKNTEHNNIGHDKQNTCLRLSYKGVEAPNCIDPTMWFHHKPDPETGDYSHYGMLMLIVNPHINAQKYINAIKEITNLLASVREDESTKQLKTVEEEEEPNPIDLVNTSVAQIQLTDTKEVP